MHRLYEDDDQKEKNGNGGGDDHDVDHVIETRACRAQELSKSGGGIRGGVHELYRLHLVADGQELVERGVEKREECLADVENGVSNFVGGVDDRRVHIQYGVVRKIHERVRILGDGEGVIYNVTQHYCV